MGGSVGNKEAWRRPFPCSSKLRESVLRTTSPSPFSVRPIGISTGRSSATRPCSERETRSSDTWMPTRTMHEHFT